MVIVGVDVSTFAVDMVRLELDSDAATWHHYTAFGGNPLDRARSLCAHGGLPVRGAVWWDDVALVAVERPAGASRRVVADLMLVLGVVVARVPSRIPVWQLLPSEWRKACGLPGNASKGLVRSWSLGQLARAHGRVIDSGPPVRLAYPEWVDGLPQDACDAYAVAYAARAINATGQPAAA